MRKVWAISDLHLCFSAPEKDMSFFGEQWSNYAQKIATHWKELISPEDLVLIPGDISWAMHLEEALIDLEWIDALPGTKVILKGNHDYWWASSTKMSKVMPPSIHFLANNTLTFDAIAIGGARLWDSKEYHFHELIQYQENPRAKQLAEHVSDEESAEKIFNRELERLKLSLSQLDPQAHIRIAMTHYPPIGSDLSPSRASKILEEFNIDLCIFGHLHNLKTSQPLFGTSRGIKYLLTSCDYLNFIPLQLL